MSTIYLSHPIDQTEDDHLARDTAAYVSSFLQELQINVYNPYRAFEVARAADATIQQVNDAALEHCDGLAAVFIKGVASIGVPIEVGRAVASGKPVLLVSNFDSVMLAAWATEENVRWVRVNTTDMLEQGVKWLAATLAELAETADRHNFGDEPKKRHRPRGKGRGRGVGAKAPIVFERKHPDAHLPERAYATDAGFDLFTSVETVLQPHRTTLVPTGVACDIPDGYFGWITGRSSTKRVRGLDITPGIIDEGYSGELLASVYNPFDEPITVKPGERLVQMILLPAVGGSQAVWGEVREKPRGDNGFGSSGSHKMHQSDEPTAKVPAQQSRLNCCPPDCAGGGVCVSEDCTCGGCVGTIS